MLRCFVHQSSTLGQCPVTICSCSIFCSDCFLSCWCIQTILMLDQVFCVALVCVLISRQRHVLLASQDILHLLDIYGMSRRSICYSNCCCNACCLACTNTLRNQVDTVDSDLVSGNMTPRCKKVINLLRKDRTIRNLDRCVVIQAFYCAVPCDNILMLFRECPVVRGDNMLADDSVGSADTGLRCNIIKVCIL